MLREYEYSSHQSTCQATKFSDYDVDLKQADYEGSPASYNDDTTLRAEERQWYIQNRDSFINIQNAAPEKEKTVAAAETVKIEVNRRRKRNICSCECFPIIEIDTTKRIDMAAGYDGVYAGNEDYTGGFCVNSNYTRASGAQNVVVNQLGDSAVIKSDESDNVACWSRGSVAGRAEDEDNDWWDSCCRPTLIAVLFIFMLAVFGLVAGLLIYNNYVTYKPRQPLPEEPCEKMFCRWGAECVSTGNGRGHCVCPTTCPSTNAPVCSTSALTYRNYCVLRKDACEKRLNIRVKHLGECETADPCREHRCMAGAKCSVVEGIPECRCPRSCPPRKKTVCGSDGNDYESACDLDKFACENELNITVRYQGKCDPCTHHECPAGAVCQLDPSRLPTCRCGPPCSLQHAPVCGSDYNSYPSECELRREACRTRTHIAIVYRGHCNTGIHPCANASCGAAEVCTLDARGVARCGCGPGCEAVLRPICASDGITYDNLCEMHRTACITNKHLRLAYEGTCGKANPCERKSCPYGGTCMALAGQATCSCPTCDSKVSTVCASDLNTYGSECKMRAHACTLSLDLKVLYNDTCETCENHKCPGNGECRRDPSTGRVSCVCPDVCPEPHESEVVCGTDGRTYPSECQLLRAACQQHTDIRLHYRGDCSVCAKINCRYGAHCSAGECVCPTDCTTAIGEPVCSNTMRTYPNECELQKAACEQSSKGNLLVIFYGECKDRWAVTMTPPEALTTSTLTTKSTLEETSETEMVTQGVTTHQDMVCRDIICDFEATCELGPDGFPKCACIFDCPSQEYFPVCASDFNIYPSQCEMKKATCLKKIELRLRPLELCKGLEVRPCGGARVVTDETTGREIDCGSGSRRQDCPVGTYCHQTVTAARCCYKNESSPQQEVRKVEPHCSETQLGCCADGITAVSDGCPTDAPTGCNCHRLGAMSAACDSEGKCICRPGVGGDRCDRCEPGYWGLPRIGNGHAGCIPCGCSVYGSVREDCEQMTGRCVCKNGVQGQKCTICTDHREMLGSNGCYNASTIQRVARKCSDLTCYFGAVCVEGVDGRSAACHCPAANCPAVEAVTDMLVCGSDGKTYQSDCNLKLQACRTQEDIVVQAFGPCMTFEYQPGTAKPYSILPFTQEDEGNTMSKSTRHLLNTDLRFRNDWHLRETVSVEDQESTVDKAPHPTERTNSVLGPLLGDLCTTDGECSSLPGSHCSMGGCVCKPFYVPSNHRRDCIPQDLTPKEESTPEYSACLSEPCFNMGTCVDLPGSTYVCLCSDLHSGPNCENLALDSDKMNYIEAPSFDGQAYIRLKPLKAYHKLDIDVHFIAYSENGVLLYDQQHEDGSGDFVSLAIVNGYVEFRYNLGDGTVALVSPEKISMGEYYRVSARRYHRDGMLSVSGMEDVAGQSIGNLKALDLTEDAYFGYVPSNISRVYDNIGTRDGFVGCVKFLRIIKHQVTKKLGRIDPLIVSMNNVKDCKANPCVSGPCKNGATCVTEKTGYSCLCAPGYQGENCADINDPCASNPCALDEICDHLPGGGYICNCLIGDGCRNDLVPTDAEMIPQLNGSSYIELPTFDTLGNEFRIEIWFQTYRQSGMLFYLGQSAKGKGDFVSLNLVNGFLQFRYNLGSGIANITYPSKISKNHWHRARAWRVGRLGRLQLDNGTYEKGEAGGTLTQLNLELPSFVGSLPDFIKAHKLSGLTSSFVGAIQRLFVNGRPISLYTASTPICGGIYREDHLPCITSSVMKYIGAPCVEDPSPCRNGAKCFPLLDDYRCICKDGFQGKNCDLSANSDMQNDVGAIKFDGESYYAYRSRGGVSKRNRIDRGVRYELKFRTYNDSGLLLWRKKIGVRPQDFIGLGIDDGYLQFIYTDTNPKDVGKTDWFQTLESRRRVDDGMWHLVIIRRRKRLALLQLDDQPPMRAYTQTPLIPSKANPKLWIGGSPTLPRGLPKSMYHGFVGCLDSIKVSGRHLDLASPIRKNKDVQFCS